MRRLLKKLRSRCRIFIITSLAISYMTAYFFLSSNSEGLFPSEEVYYVGRRSNKNTTEVKSLYESHLYEIQRKASAIARVYQPVR